MKTAHRLWSAGPMPARGFWLLLGFLALFLFPADDPLAGWLERGYDGCLESSSGEDPDSSRGSDPPVFPLLSFRIGVLSFVPFLAPRRILPPAPPVRGRRARQSARLGGQRPPPDPHPEVKS
jgi:hypothetical protein